MRVATINLWGRRGPYPERLALLRAELARLSPDVVGLQEVRTDGGSQAAELGEGRYHEAFGQALELPGGGYGNALLSRFPILSAETLPLPNAGAAEPRVLLSALLDTPDGTLPFLVTHLAWEGHQGTLRVAQTGFIADHVAGLSADLPPVLVGDFNAGPRTEEIALLTEPVPGLVDAWDHAGDGGPGHTYAETNGYAGIDRPHSERIDYVFCGTGPGGRGVPLRAELAFTTPVDGVWPSDHYGLLVETRP